MNHIISLITVAITMNAMNTFSQVTDTFTDLRDGKIYKTVKSETQTWLAENLAYKIDSGCWAYNNDESFVGTYGYLYNWEAAKKFCPAGWHLPSDDEWKILEKHLGMSDMDLDKSHGDQRISGNVGLKLRSTGGWTDNGNGSNESGFNALPAGWKDTLDVQFYDLGSDGDFWTATEYDGDHAWARLLVYDAPKGVYRYYRHGFKKAARSVRCLKDN
jgi:uncharacterized protein (TIGR02145 family)